MKSILRRSAVAAVALVAMASCIDDKYDLSDIDTSVRVSVDNLIIPINLDEIKLESVIDTTDEIRVVNGVYAYVTDGTFDSDPIHVNKVTIEDQTINTAELVLAVVGQPQAGADVSYQIANQSPSEFKYEAMDVPAEIHSLSAIHANTYLSAHIDVTDLAPVANAVTFEDVKMQMPKGLIFDHSVPSGSYDPESGVFTLDQIRVTTASVYDVTLYFTGINIAPEDFEAANRKLSVTGALTLTEGEFIIKSTDFKQGATFVQNADLKVDYQVPGFEVKSFDGWLEYDVDSFDVPEVNLSDIPDFLNQEGTNLVIKNPMLYMHANNPVQQLGLYAQTGFSITAIRPGEANQTFGINDPFFTIGKDENAAISEFNFVLAPDPDAAFSDPAYPNPQPVEYDLLSDVLSGNGLPKTLQVNLTDTKIPLQEVNGFLLGQDYPAVHGTYKMVAPFDLGAGSHILYTDTIDDWGGDLDKLTITTLEVAFNATTNVPVSVKLTGYPIDKYGNQIGNVKIEETNISANAQDEKVVIRISGEIKNLDGIIFTAEATASGNGNALGPDLTIKLTNVRPKVAGYYEDEL